LDGERDITVSLLAAQDPVDTGDIYHQLKLMVSPDQLLAEINEALFAAEFALMDWAVANIDAYQPRPQVGEPSYCTRRTSADSQIDPSRPIVEQFDILRLADAVRFPAYFDLHGSRYIIALNKLESASNAN
jgi:methionyl-tRNA formyltransferase